jgi:hypothetical protein
LAAYLAGAGSPSECIERLSPGERPGARRPGPRVPGPSLLHRSPPPLSSTARRPGAGPATRRTRCSEITLVHAKIGGSFTTYHAVSHVLRSEWQRRNCRGHRDDAAAWELSRMWRRRALRTGARGCPVPGLRRRMPRVGVFGMRCRGIHGHCDHRHSHASRRRSHHGPGQTARPCRVTAAPGRALPGGRRPARAPGASRHNVPSGHEVGGHARASAGRRGRGRGWHGSW